MGMRAGQLSYSKEMEAEADYVGLYILANSGFDIHTGPNVFRRLGVSNPRSWEAKYATSHPSTPERFVMVEQTIKEIDGKKAANMSILPEEKSKKQKVSQEGSN